MEEVVVKQQLCEAEKQHLALNMVGASTMWAPWKLLNNFFSRYNMDMCEMYYEDGRQNDEKPGELM